MRWRTPKRCCSSTTARRRSRKATSRWKSAWVPTRIAISPAASAASLPARSAPLSRPVRISSRTPAASASGASESRCWRARISVGAISAAWPPASTAASMASSATSVLPDADVALQQPVHPQRRGHVGGDLRHRAGLGAGRGVGQRGEHLRRAAGRRRGWRSPWRASSGRGPARGSSGGRAARRRRAARGPGRPARGRRAGSGAWAAASAACQSGHSRRRFRLGSIHSGSGRRGRAPRARRGSWRAGSGPRSADRPARSRAASLAGAQDVVGMHHLGEAVEELDPAGDDAPLAGRAACGAASPRGRGRRRAGTRSGRRGRGRGRGGCGAAAGWCRPTSTSTVTTSGSSAPRTEGAQPAVDAAGRQGEDAGATGWAISMRAKSRAVFGPTPSSAVSSAKSGKRTSGRAHARRRVAAGRRARADATLCYALDIRSVTDFADARFVAAWACVGTHAQAMLVSDRGGRSAMHAPRVEGPAAVCRPLTTGLQRADEVWSVATADAEIGARHPGGLAPVAAWCEARRRFDACVTSHAARPGGALVASLLVLAACAPTSPDGGGAGEPGDAGDVRGGVRRRVRRPGDPGSLPDAGERAAGGGLLDRRAAGVDRRRPLCHLPLLRARRRPRDPLPGRRRRDGAHLRRAGDGRDASASGRTGRRPPT